MGGAQLSLRGAQLSSGGLVEESDEGGVEEGVEENAEGGGGDAAPGGRLG